MITNQEMREALDAMEIVAAYTRDHGDELPYDVRRAVLRLALLVAKFSLMAVGAE